MSDLFVDDLYDRLHAAREKSISEAAASTLSRERIAQAARTWWEEFSRALEGKVQAWNAKGDINAHLTYTQALSGPITLWHRSVEAELRLSDSRIVLTSRVGDTQPRESPFIVFREARGGVSVVLAGGVVESPSDAADRLLEPILTRAFTGQTELSPFTSPDRTR